jgi:hypothetical protein
VRVYHIPPLAFYLTKGHLAFGYQNLKVLLDDVALVVGIVEDEDVKHSSSIILENF